MTAVHALGTLTPRVIALMGLYVPIVPLVELAHAATVQHLRVLWEVLGKLSPRIHVTGVVYVVVDADVKSLPWRACCRDVRRPPRDPSMCVVRDEGERSDRR
jgi:hypothetical protein